MSDATVAGPDATADRPEDGDRPDVVIILTDQERAAPPYEDEALRRWRDERLTGRRWFADHGVTFDRHYVGSLACVPSRPTLFTGQFPDVHGVTQTDGLGKLADDSRMRWLRPGEVPTLGHWFRAAGYDTHYDGKWHLSHAELTDPVTGERIATNDADGTVLTDGVRAYRDADPLDPFGFGGWIGPEPHGPLLADSGLVRDPIIAARVVAWLEDRYRRRAAGDPAALRPFLLVASFVNPHDIVLFPAWVRSSPIGPSPADPPPVPPAPTADEDLATKPAAQVAYRESYPSAYGPAPAVERIYRHNAQRYRDLYHRLHAEVDGPLDRVRAAVTDHATGDTVIVRTSDHGELLGAHGGLHQKWFTLYDEATRVPFTIVRWGGRATAARTVDDVPTSHVDLVPTLLGMAGLDAEGLAATLRRTHTEVHPLPGRDLSALIDGDSAEHGGTDGVAEGAGRGRHRAIYLMTRDNMMEGDSGASGFARRIHLDAHARGPLAISVAAHVGANFEGIVVRVDDGEADGAGAHLWKLVRTFDDPATWTEPGVSQLAANGPGGEVLRTTPLADEWELYDLDADPFEAANRWDDPAAAAVRRVLVDRLAAERAACVPARNTPWPMASRHPAARRRAATPPAPARWVRRAVQRLGMHPDDDHPFTGRLDGRRALIVCTNHGTLDIGTATGVYASELTAPYYAFVDAGMAVDVASPAGGIIPVDPLSLRPVLRAASDDRFLADDELRSKVSGSLAVGSLDLTDYDVVFLAGGWGAAFDFGTSDVLADRITEANAASVVLGGVCHGPLGLINARATDGGPLVRGRRITAVTDKQVQELGIGSTPMHPETELRRRGAAFESTHRFRDPFANHWVVDGNLVTGQNQNAGPMVAREMMALVAARTGAVDPADQRSAQASMTSAP